MIAATKKVLVSLVAFLLPWQTILLFGYQEVAGQVSMFGVRGIYAVEILMLVLLVLSFAQPLLEEQKQLGWRISVFILVLLLSLFTSSFLPVGWFFVLHVVAVAGFFFALSDKRLNVERIIFWFVAGLVLPSLIGWWQVGTGGNPAVTLLGLAEKDALMRGVSVVATEVGRLMRAHGTFPHPNIFGGYLVIGLLCLLWMGGRAMRSQRLFLFLLTGFFSATLVMTFSRSAWLALMFSLLLIGVFGFIRLRTWSFLSKVQLSLLLIILLTMVGTALAFHSQVLARVNSELPLEQQSINERVGQYEMYDEVVGDRWVVGVGPQVYTFALADRFPGKVVWDYQPVHNSFLLAFAEVGVVGLMVFIYLLCAVFNRFSSSKFTWGFISALTIIALFDHYLWSLWPGLVLTFFVLFLLFRLPQRS